MRYCKLPQYMHINTHTHTHNTTNTCAYTHTHTQTHCTYCLQISLWRQKQLTFIPYCLNSIHDYRQLFSELHTHSTKWHNYTLAVIKHRYTIVSNYFHYNYTVVIKDRKRCRHSCCSVWEENFWTQKPLQREFQLQWLLWMLSMWSIYTNNRTTTNSHSTIGIKLSYLVAFSYLEPKHSVCCWISRLVVISSIDTWSLAITPIYKFSIVSVQHRQMGKISGL